MAEKKDVLDGDSWVNEKQQSAECNLNEAPSLITGDKSLEANMKWDFENATKIPAQGCLQTLFCCNKEKKYQRMLKRADSTVAWELDLTKYIERSRIHSFMTLISLSRHQQLIADKMSTCLIRESSDLNDNSQNDFELEKEQEYDFEQLSSMLFQRRTIQDQRLIKAFQCKRWFEDSKRNKGRSNAFSRVCNEQYQTSDGGNQLLEG